MSRGRGRPRKIDPRHAPLFDLDQLAAEAAREAAAAGLPDWWAGLPDGPAMRDEPVGKCLYSAPTRGFAGRVADLALWVSVYGNFGSAIRSHAWRPDSIRFHSVDHNPEGVAAFQLDRHEPVPLDCDLRRVRLGVGRKLEPVPPCGHDADAETRTGWRPLEHRGACRKTGCDWEGPVRDTENAAIEDGMDHAWPKWRTLPPVPRVPENAWNAKSSKAAAKSLASWMAKVTEVYPAGWVEGGGPIRTARRTMESRHVEAHTPFGGYDLALTCHLCGATENLTWLDSGGVCVAGCAGGCPERTPS